VEHFWRSGLLFSMLFSTHQEIVRGTCTWFVPDALPSHPDPQGICGVFVLFISNKRTSIILPSSVSLGSQMDSTWKWLYSGVTPPETDYCKSHFHEEAGLSHLTQSPVECSGGHVTCLPWPQEYIFKLLSPTFSRPKKSMSQTIGIPWVMSAL
jgi:hypothetical protein